MLTGVFIGLFIVAQFPVTLFQPWQYFLRDGRFSSQITCDCPGILLVQQPNLAPEEVPLGILPVLDTVQ